MRVQILIICLFAAAVTSLVAQQPSGEVTLMDVHGAGAQRSDPKTGDPADYPTGHGPQGDVIRIFNYVRPVRSVSSIDRPYTVVDTGQQECFDESSSIRCPRTGRSWYGQDGHYSGVQPQYRDNRDGTVTDLATGLMWQQDPGDKMTAAEADAALPTIRLGGYSDWRLPSIKELYSLILFSGRDVSVSMQSGEGNFVPFIDTEIFDFEYGDTNSGERIIDSQFLSSTRYVSTTMGGAATVFGVNFADGRIKGYPYSSARGGSDHEFFVLFVRGGGEYGINNFVDNRDGTVTDRATGLMWLKEDHGPLNWGDALEWAENLNTAGYDDWRLPDAKELQSIVDYSRSPNTTGSAAIDPVFSVSTVTDEGGDINYPFYWSSTTHADARENGRAAVYVAFGEALGFMGGGQEETRPSQRTPQPSGGRPQPGQRPRR